MDGGVGPLRVCAGEAVVSLGTTADPPKVERRDAPGKQRKGE
jgi:hypothetical protein